MIDLALISRLIEQEHKRKNTHGNIPHRHALLRKLCDKQASSRCCESRAIALRPRVRNRAALVRVRLERAVGGVDKSALGGACLVESAALKSNNKVGNE